MGNDHTDEIVHRELDTETDSPAAEVATRVAELKGTETDELAPAWKCIDGVLEEIFSNPPASEAQMEVAFSYEGYRITVKQNGRLELVEVQ